MRRSITTPAQPTLSAHLTCGTSKKKRKSREEVENRGGGTHSQAEDDSLDYVCNNSRCSSFGKSVKKRMGKNDVIIVPMIGTLFSDETDAIRVLRDDLLDVCYKRELNASCIITYMRYLYTTDCIGRAKYAFGNPAGFNRHTKKDDKNRYIQSLAQEHGDKALVIPYNPGGHWVLIVIVLTEMQVYWLDSLGKQPDPGFKLELNTAIQISNLSSGKPKRLNPNPDWEYVMCPQQGDGILCGYYVMSFMRHFFADAGQSLKRKVTELASIKTYTTKEIDKIRLEFIDFIEGFLPL